WSVFRLVPLGVTSQVPDAVSSSAPRLNEMPADWTRGAAVAEPAELPLMSQPEASPNLRSALEESRDAIAVPPLRSAISRRRLAAIAWMVGIALLTIRWGINTLRLQIRKRSWTLASNQQIVSLL